MYKIWNCVFVNRLAPLLNILTDEAHAAYKPNRSTLGVLSLIANEVKQSNANQLIIIDLSEASGGIERRTIWGILYEKGTPRRYISAQQQVHTRAQLRPQIDGKLGNGNKRQQRGFPRGPLSAQLFTIYIDAMIHDYDKALPDTIKQTHPETYEMGGIRRTGNNCPFMEKREHYQEETKTKTAKNARTKQTNSKKRPTNIGWRHKNQNWKH